jgi:hypothetical protein
MRHEEVHGVSIAGMVLFFGISGNKEIVGGPYEKENQFTRIHNDFN